MGCVALIVLDTHIWIWLIQGDARLGSAAREIIQREVGEKAVLVAAISIWETAMLVGRGQLALPVDISTWTRRAFDETGLRLAPLEPQIAIDTARMSWTHRDPADRMIVATARHWQAPLMTVDREIRAFGETGALVVIDGGT